MPFVDVKVSCGIDRAQEEAIKAGLGQAIALIPGKSESSLMVQFSDNCRLWFGGQQDGPIAFLNVMIYGASTGEAYNSFSDSAIALLQKELGAKHVYVKFEEVPNWFWD